MNNSKTLTKIAIAIGLIGLAVGWRIINYNFHLAPNLEIVTTVSVLAAITLGFKAGLIVPLTTMILSDLFIGNSSIFMVTWSSFAIIGASAIVLRKLNNQPKNQIMYSAGFAILSSLFFFVATNFGVWLQGWYPMTWTGLVQCFVNAIPFYRTMLIGNIILVPAAVSVWQMARIKFTSKQSVVNTLVR